VSETAVPAISSDEYRRAARRLRCRYAGRPEQLQRSLKTLAARAVPTSAHRAERDPVVVLSQATPTSGVAGLFAEHLAREIPPSGVLTYSARLGLLRYAHRLGVRRFEANLLIAAMLERSRRQHRIDVDIEQPPSDRTSMLAQLAMFLLAQGAIGLGAWWTIFR
jgi:hypothetical protein